jgi:mono/diheme cytochrome c family protein
VIGTIVFVAIFVVLGLTVVLAAMRSGRGVRGRRPESRTARRAWGLGLGAAIVLVGLGLPVLVLVANADNHAKQGPSGVDLTSAEAHGRELFAKNCATCHTLAATHSVGRVGPNLDELGAVQGKPAFVLDAIKNGRARGMGQMPAGLLTGQDAKDVAQFVATVSGR